MISEELDPEWWLTDQTPEECRARLDEHAATIARMAAAGEQLAIL